MKRLLLISLFLLAGCRPCSSPDLYLPDCFTEGDSVERCQMGEEEVPLACWWEQFNDPLLISLIERGLECNYDLRIARERICEARAVYGIEYSARLPHVDAFTLFDRMRNSLTLSDSLFTGGRFVNFYQAGFDAIWELDLFGKIYDRTKAAAYEVAAAREEVRDVHVTVASEIAVKYFIIRTLQERLEITYNHIRAEQELLELVTERFKAGLIPELDVYNAKALLQERYAVVPIFQTRLYQTIYSLAVLLGELPEVLVNSFCDELPLPCSGGKIPLGLPSELLCRRPDIRRAEFAMHASGARVMAARKEVFPTVSLEALYSYATGFFTLWSSDQSRQWDYLPIVSLPLFHGGEIISRIRVETSIQRQRVLEYEKTVIEALSEVESALVAYFQEGARIEALKEEVNAYAEARELARILYVGGFVDFLNVIDTEHDMYLSQILLAESKEFLMTHLVAIYKSLGGGWECCD